MGLMHLTSTDRGWTAGVFDAALRPDGRLRLSSARRRVRKLLLNLLSRRIPDRLDMALLSRIESFRLGGAPGRPRLAWLAGVLDVRGSIYGEWRPTQGTYVGCVSLSSANEPLMRAVEAAAGVGHLVREGPARLRWRVSARQARELIERVGPFMVERTAQAALLRSGHLDSASFAQMQVLNGKPR